MGLRAIGPVLAALLALAGCGPRVEVPHDAQETELLEAALAPAGLSIAKLRDVGYGARLDHPLNKLAIAWDEGHVRMLALQDAGVPALPALGGLRNLETLALPNNKLQALPDLSGNAALKTLDLSGNRIAVLDPAHLPPGLETLDLSGNPLADLTPLSRLTSLKTLNIAGDPVTDLSPLAKLANLTELKASGTRVTDISPLIDLTLTADLRNCRVAQLPVRLPKDRDFRVDLKGCPVSKPPGVLDEWSFSTTSVGVPGGVVTRSGAVSGGSFEANGTWQVVPKLSTVSIPSTGGSAGGPVNVEVKVSSGKLRLFLAAAKDPRGPWFDHGFVKGFDGFLRGMVMTYADATPGHPVRKYGHLTQSGSGDEFYFVVQPVGSQPVDGMTWRVWRD